LPARVWKKGINAVGRTPRLLSAGDLRPGGRLIESLKSQNDLCEIRNVKFKVFQNTQGIFEKIFCGLTTR
jgi:hypothetical protein